MEELASAIAKVNTQGKDAIECEFCSNVLTYLCMFLRKFIEWGSESP